jgi:hypothetical protein
MPFVKPSVVMLGEILLSAITLKGIKLSGE